MIILKIRLIAMMRSISRSFSLSKYTKKSVHVRYKILSFLSNSLVKQDRKMGTGLKVKHIMGSFKTGTKETYSKYFPLPKFSKEKYLVPLH